MVPAKKKLLFCPAPMKGHVVHTARLCEFFVAFPDEYEAHVACSPEVEGFLPEGVIFHPQNGGMTLSVFESIFAAVSEGKTELEAQAIMMNKMDVDALQTTTLIIIDLMKQLQPSCVIFEHAFNIGNMIWTACKSMSTPGVQLVAMARPESALNPFKLLQLMIFYPKAVKRALSAIKSIPKEVEKTLGTPMLPESDKPYTIFPGPEVLVEVRPKAKEIYTGPFLPLPLDNASPSLKRSASSRFSRELEEAPELRTWATEQRASDRKVVYIALGTLATPSTQLLARLVEALEGSPYSVIWALPEAHQALLPKKLDSSRWYVHKFLPQAAIFRSRLVKCFVSHCGASSSVEAMANGIPMVCLPFFGDQHEWAYSISKHVKAGVKIDKLKSSSADIKKAVTSVMEDPRYMANAEACASTMVNDARMSLESLGPKVECSSKRVGVPVAAAVIEKIIARQNPMEVLPPHLRGQPSKTCTCCG